MTELNPSNKQPNSWIGEQEPAGLKELTGPLDAIEIYQDELAVGFHTISSDDELRQFATDIDISAESIEQQLYDALRYLTSHDHDEDSIIEFLLGYARMVNRAYLYTFTPGYRCEECLEHCIDLNALASQTKKQLEDDPSMTSPETLAVPLRDGLHRINLHVFDHQICP